jgi:hypothetical protein
MTKMLNIKFRTALSTSEYELLHKLKHPWSILNDMASICNSLLLVRHIVDSSSMHYNFQISSEEKCSYAAM